MKIELVEYDSNWSEIYINESKIIEQVLGDNCLAIHHFGSTSILGLIAKPKIDILAVVKDLSSIDVSVLEKIGFKNRGEIIKSGRYFSKDKPKIHLHIFEENNPNIEKDLKFRDWIRTHEDDRNDYAKLKRELAKIYDDGMEYCEAKTDFINKILSKIDGVIKNNQEKFTAVRKLKLPKKQYAITGSGPLGIRNLKKINDIDIIVTSELWDKLVLKYGFVEKNNIKKIVIPNSCIEIFSDSSFGLKEKNELSINERIATAEIIDGLSYESLQNILYYKNKMKRDKDLTDIKIIRSYFDAQKHNKNFL